MKILDPEKNPNNYNIKSHSVAFRPLVIRSSELKDRCWVKNLSDVVITAELNEESNLGIESVTPLAFEPNIITFIDIPFDLELAKLIIYPANETGLYLLQIGIPTRLFKPKVMPLTQETPFDYRQFGAALNTSLSTINRIAPTVTGITTIALPLNLKDKGAKPLLVHDESRQTVIIFNTSKETIKIWITDEIPDPDVPTVLINKGGYYEIPNSSTSKSVIWGTAPVNGCNVAITLSRSVSSPNPELVA